LVVEADAGLPLKTAGSRSRLATTVAQLSRTGLSSGARTHDDGARLGLGSRVRSRGHRRGGAADRPGCCSHARHGKATT
jgi:hypothetical protein